MHSRQSFTSDFKYVRISKFGARNRFNRGETVHLMAVNRVITNSSYPESIRKGIDSIVGKWTFDQHVKDFIRWNCCYKAGYYPAFYTKTKQRRHHHPALYTEMEVQTNDNDEKPSFDTPSKEVRLF